MFKHPEQRVGVFVDTANMYHSAKNIYHSNVNFGEVLETVVAGRKLIRAIAYVIKSTGEEESTFFDALEKQGFEIKSKDLQIFSSGLKKADWDVGLAVDTIKMADSLDTIVIVSGDGDFRPLVTYLRENKGCLVEVAAFEQTVSSKLREEVDDFVNLTEDLDKFLISSKKGKARRSTRSASRKTSARKTSTARKTSKSPVSNKKKRKVFF